MKLLTSAAFALLSHWEWLLASQGRTEHSHRNTCTKLSFCIKYPVTTFPLFFLSPSKEITPFRKGPLTLRWSKCLNVIFLSVMCTSLAVIKDNQLSVLSRAASMVAMLICTCSNGDASNTRTTQLRAGHAVLIQGEYYDDTDEKFKAGFVSQETRR